MGTRPDRIDSLDPSFSSTRCTYFDLHTVALSLPLHILMFLDIIERSTAPASIACLFLSNAVIGRSYLGAICLFMDRLLPRFYTLAQKALFLFMFFFAGCSKHAAHHICFLLCSPRGSSGWIHVGGSRDTVFLVSLSFGSPHAGDGIVDGWKYIGRHVLPRVHLIWSCPRPNSI